MRMRRRHKSHGRKVRVGGVLMRLLSESEICRLQWAVERARSGVPLYLSSPLA